MNRTGESHRNPTLGSILTCLVTMSSTVVADVKPQCWIELSRSEQSAYFEAASAYDSQLEGKQAFLPNSMRSNVAEHVLQKLANRIDAIPRSALSPQRIREMGRTNVFEADFGTTISELTAIDIERVSEIEQEALDHRLEHSSGDLDSTFYLVLVIFGVVACSLVVVIKWCMAKVFGESIVNTPPPWMPIDEDEDWTQSLL